uniref:Putative ovule protein n=1 Tax=Solanum chacoense TaxID=4108 RepID=A0A0V0HML8_SOLCH
MRMKTREIKEKWITIKYDYMPKYCNSCKLQGHNEKECFILHPKLYPKEEEDEEKNKDNTNEDIIENIKVGQTCHKQGEGGSCDNKGKEKKGEEEFEVQNIKKFPKRGRQYHKDRVEMVWHPRPEQHKGQMIQITNKFGTLTDNQEDGVGEGELRSAEPRLGGETEGV